MREWLRLSNYTRIVKVSPVSTVCTGSPRCHSHVSSKITLLQWRRVKRAESADNCWSVLVFVARGEGRRNKQCLLFEETATHTHIVASLLQFVSFPLQIQTFWLFIWCTVGSRRLQNHGKFENEQGSGDWSDYRLCWPCALDPKCPYWLDFVPHSPLSLFLLVESLFFRQGFWASAAQGLKICLRPLVVGFQIHAYDVFRVVGWLRADIGWSLISSVADGMWLMFLFGCGGRGSMSALRAFWNSPVGPKTTHFWGPVANWGFVLAVSSLPSSLIESLDMILLEFDSCIGMSRFYSLMKLVVGVSFHRIC